MTCQAVCTQITGTSLMPDLACVLNMMMSILTKHYCIHVTSKPARIGSRLKIKNGSSGSRKRSHKHNHKNGH